MSGWIKLHRSILDHPRASDPDWVAVWIYLLVNAAHKPQRALFNGKIITLEPGQLLTGRKVISEATGVGEPKTKRLLYTMEREGQIRRKSSHKGSLISIKNWGEYQGDGGQLNGQQEKSLTPLQFGINEREKNETDSRTDNWWTTGGQLNGQQKELLTTLKSDTNETREKQSGQLDSRKVDTVQEDKNKNIEDTDVSSRPSKKPDPKNTEKYQKIADAWNELNGLPKVERLTDKRKTSLRSRLSDPYWRENWQRAMEQIPSSDFLSGRKTKWRATFDWFIRPESVVKIIEGQYHDGARQPTIYSDSEKY